MVDGVTMSPLLRIRGACMAVHWRRGDAGLFQLSAFARRSIVRRTAPTFEAVTLTCWPILVPFTSRENGCSASRRFPVMGEPGIRLQAAENADPRGRWSVAVVWASGADDSAFGNSA